MNRPYVPGDARHANKEAIWGHNRETLVEKRSALQPGPPSVPVGGLLVSVGGAEDGLLT